MRATAKAGKAKRRSLAKRGAFTIKGAGRARRAITPRAAVEVGEGAESFGSGLFRRMPTSSD